MNVLAKPKVFVTHTLCFYTVFSKVVFLSRSLFISSLGCPHTESVQYWLHCCSALPTYRKERIINSSLFNRISTFCAKDELSSTFHHSHQQARTLYTISQHLLGFPSSLPLPFWPSFPLSFSQFWLLASSQRGDGMRRWWGGGVGVKSELSLSDPHRHTLFLSHTHMYMFADYTLFPLCHGVTWCLNGALL